MDWAEFTTIAIAHLFAVASPGPDFAVVMRQTVTVGREGGLWTSVGVGLGILLHVGYCILGVALLLAQSPELFNAMKWVAACYLFYLGLRACRQALSRETTVRRRESETSMRPLRAIGLGFLTNGLNPKATLFFLALFTLVISPATPTAVQLAYGVYLSVATFAWFAFMTLLLDRPLVRRFLLHAGNWFEGGMGLILIILALQLAYTGIGQA